MRKCLVLLLGFGLTILAGGCVMTDPQRAAELARPETVPVRNITGFSASLRCMDDLFLQFGRTTYFITSQGIPDETGEVRAGTKEMLISSISTMSVQSNAFSFVDFDQSQIDIDFLQKISATPGNLLPADFIIPTFYIRGAITQLDSGVISDSVSAAISAAAADLGAGKDKVVSVVSVDLNVGNVQTRRMLPGVSASNSIAVSRSGAAIDGGALLKSYGLNFNVSLNKSEGMAQAVRTLVELSTIEVLGRLVQVPYWRCLQIEQTNPEIVAISRGWFDQLGERERISFVQRALRSLGRYDGQATGTLDLPTREAIGAYQAEHRLIADGRINYDLYASLISGDLALGRAPHAEGPSAPYRPVDTPVQPPIVLTVSTFKGPHHRYSAGEPFTVTLRSTADAFTYCYYLDADGNVIRIFPNRFQPDPLIEADRVTQVPREGDGFELVPERPGSREEVLCLAAERDIGGTLPEALKGADLTPLPARSVEEMLARFEIAARAPVVSSRVALQVLP